MYKKKNWVTIISYQNKNFQNKETNKYRVLDAEFT